jgi:hypothetical protein
MADPVGSSMSAFRKNYSSAPAETDSQKRILSKLQGLTRPSFFFGFIVFIFISTMIISRGWGNF